MPKIKIEQEEIEYTLSRRSKKYINISIQNNGNIFVSAPKRVPLYEIENVIKEKYDWIRKQLSKQIYKKNEFEDGKLVWYKGLQYEIKTAESKKNNVDIFGNMIIISTKNKDSEYVKNIFYKWLYNTGEYTFRKESDRWLDIMSEYNIPKHEIQVRKMKSRWGSCIPSKKKICLNIALMNVPTACMEYVVLHELTHFIEPNHSKKFYNIIENYMPDWKTRKNKLNKEFGNIL